MATAEVQSIAQPMAVTNVEHTASQTVDAGAAAADVHVSKESTYYKSKQLRQVRTVGVGFLLIETECHQQQYSVLRTLYRMC